VEFKKEEQQMVWKLTLRQLDLLNTNLWMKGLKGF